MGLTSNIKDKDWVSVRQGIARLGSSKLGPTSTPTFLGVTTTSLTISGLTTDSLIYPVSGLLTSLGVAANGQIPIGSTGTTPVLANITATANQITVTNGVGTIALSFPNSLVIPGKLTAGSFGSPTDVTGGGQYGFELHYSGNNYSVTGIRSRAQLVTTDTTATALGGLFQAANNDDVNAGVLMGFMAEAIGKSTANASTITTMRGGLIGTEWGALNTVTNLKTLHIRGHSLNAAGAGSFGTGYALYIENEAVGGNGQAYDAGIYFKGTALSAGNKAFTYGIDFTGAIFGTAEMLIGNAKITSSNNSLIFQPNADSATFLQVKNAAGTSCPLNIDTTNNRVGIRTTGPDRVLEINTGAAEDGLRISYDDADGSAAKYTELTVNSTGDAKLRVQGQYITFEGLDAGVGAVENLRIRFLSATTISLSSPSGIPNIAWNFNFKLNDNYSMTLGSENDFGVVYNLGDDELRIQHPRFSPTSKFIYGADDTWEFRKGSDSRLFIDGDGNTGFNENSPETPIELTHATPIIQQQVSTHTNDDDARKSIWRAKGNKLDETEHTLGQFSFSHDGTGDDYDAKWVLSLNGTTGGVDTLVGALTLDSNLLATLGGSLSVPVGSKIGIGTPNPTGEIEVSTNTSSTLRLNVYSTTNAIGAAWVSRKSNSNTIGTVVQTDSGDSLGSFFFLGVSTGNLFASAASIVVMQAGVSGSGSVPATMEFNTYGSSRNDNQLFLDGPTGYVGVGVIPTLSLDINAKSGNTAIGGFAVKMTNKTGVASVAGKVVECSGAVDDAVALSDADGDHSIGVFLDSGIADGSETWIVVGGVADVLYEDGESSTRDQWVFMSGTAGFAQDQAATPGHAADHWKEIGHCCETVTYVDTPILARCILHFN